MDFRQFSTELGVTGKVLSITRKNGVEPYNPVTVNCAFQSLINALDGETVRLSLETVACAGGKYGFGFTDQLMPNYGQFVAHKPGSNTGMRLKLDPEFAEQSAALQPANVMDGFEIIEIKPFEDSDTPDLVTVLASPDQLSALNLLFNFRQLKPDLIIFPAGSGCSSVFRLPFAELLADSPRAVIGNADVSVRPAFDPSSLFFTVTGNTFRQMLADADISFLSASAWKKLKERIS